MRPPCYLPRLLTGLNVLLASLSSFGQVQSNAGYSLQVLPSKVLEPSAATVVTAGPQTVPGAAERAALMQQYRSAPNHTTFRTARVDFGREYRYGVVTDGDFTKAVGKDGVAPTTGSLGQELRRVPARDLWPALPGGTNEWHR